MNDEMALWLSIGAGVLAVLYGIISTQWIIKQPAGNDRMQEIQQAIQEGANAYMNRQYMTIGVVGVVLFIALTFALGWTTFGPGSRRTMRPAILSRAASWRCRHRDEMGSARPNQALMDHASAAMTM